MIKRRKANILTENIIFIILNLLFLSILILFVFSKSGGAAVLEEKYSKQIALILDSAKPGMTIRLNMDDALNKKEKEFDANSIVSVQNNLVTVKLRDKGGYSYTFFNDVNVNYYFDAETSSYIFIINNYNEGIENEEITEE